MLCMFDADTICIDDMEIGDSINGGITFVRHAYDGHFTIETLVLPKYFNPRGYRVGALKVFEEGVLTLINDKDG